MIGLIISWVIVILAIILYKLYAKYLDKHPEAPTKQWDPQFSAFIVGLVLPTIACLILNILHKGEIYDGISVLVIWFCIEEIRIKDEKIEDLENYIKYKGEA